MAEQNKPLVTSIFTADPSAHVFDGKIYVYPSHDLPHNGEDNDDGDEYQMADYHILSMDDLDSPCVDNGEVLNEKEVDWVSHQMWAPDAAFKDGTYYLFFPAKDKQGIFRIGVATGKTPAGKFTPEKNYIPGSFSIDPAVFGDDDGNFYMYFGGIWGGQLEKWQTGEYVQDPHTPVGKELALCPKVAKMSADLLTFESAPVDLMILDENGKPFTAEDTDRRFFEASWMHKYKDTYYFSYSTGDTHYLCYATSKNPMGPFTYGGRILEPVLGWTTHHSIVEYKGKWYLFYHDCELSNGINHRRCVKFTEIQYREDGSIVTIDPSKL